MISLKIDLFLFNFFIFCRNFGAEKWDATFAVGS